MATIKIIDSGLEKYSLKSDTNVLGRMYDNNAEAVDIIIPEAEAESVCYANVVSCDGEVIDRIKIENNSLPISSNLTQYCEIYIGFSFIRPDDTEKQSEQLKFGFLYAIKPQDFMPEQSDTDKALAKLMASGFIKLIQDGNTVKFYNWKDIVVGTIHYQGIKGFKIVDELPTENIDPQIIYLVKETVGEEYDYYNEYIYVDGKWELLGSTRIDLSNYYTKEQVDKIIETLTGIFNEKVDIINKNIDKKFDKIGGTVTGDVVVGGNFTVQGKTTTVDSETLRVADKLIEVGKGNTAPLTSPAGLFTPKYDGKNNGGIVYDNTGTAYVGDIVLDENGNVDVAKSNLQPIATRENASSFEDKHLPVWDKNNQRLADSGYTPDDFVDLKTQQSIAGMKTFTDEVHFGTTHFSKDLNVDNAAVKIFDNLKDLVTQYKADSIVIDNGTGSSAVQYVLTLPKKTGMLLLDLFKFSQFETSNDGDNWTLNDSTKNLEIKYQDANSHSGLQIEKDYIELSDINGTGTAKISLASNILSLDSEDKEGNHKLVRISPSKVSIGNGTDTFLVEIDSLSTKFNNRPQVKDNGNYVNVALVDDLNNYVASQSGTADKYYAQITNENGIISARIFKNGEADVQNLIISKDGVTVLGKNVANTEQVDGKVDKLAASLRNQAYVRNANGEDSGLGYTYTDEGGTLAVRNASGQLQVSDPSQGKDATNKSYADNLTARYVSTSILGG